MRFNYGYRQAYGSALKYYGLDTLMNGIGRRHKLSFSITDTVLLMLLERLQEPAGKRCNNIQQTGYVGL